MARWAAICPRSESPTVSITRHSLLISFAEKYIALVLNVVGSMIVARLLTPAEIGTYSIGAVVVGMAQLVREFGVSQYLVQEKHLSDDKIRAAFTLTVIVAWTMALLLVLLSNEMAAFYGEPQVRMVLRVLAVNCLLIPFGSITPIYLRRQLKFGALWCINVLSALAQFGVSVGMAASGFGFMSLAWAAVAGTGAAVLASLYFRPKEMPWKPGLRGVKPLLSFGVYATSANILDESGIAAPDLIIGKIVNMEGVGLFDKAQGVLNIFDLLVTRAVSPVVLPIYAALAREDKDVKGAFLKLCSYMAILAWPFFAVLGILALPVIRVLYGDQWDACAPLTRIMCLGFALFVLFGMSREILVAMGQVKMRARLEAIAVSARIAGIAIAAPFGLEAVAWSVLATTILRSMLIYRGIAHLVDLRWREWIAAVSPGLIITGYASVIPLIVINTMGLDHGALLPTAAGGAGAIAGWIIGLILTNHPLKHDLIAMLTQLRQRLPIRSMRQ